MENHSASMIVPLGITAYSFVALAAITGLTRWKTRAHWPKPIYHFIIGIIALIVATTHATLVIFV